MRFREFFVRGGEGVQAPQPILQYIYRGGPMVLLHIFQGSNLFHGGGGGPNANFYRNPYNYKLWFSRGGLDPLSPLWIRTWVMWHFCTNLCGLLLSLETPNANQSIVFKRLAKAQIRLRICAGWSKPLVLAHTTLLEIAAHLLVQKMHYGCISGRNFICLIKNL